MNFLETVLQAKRAEVALRMRSAPVERLKETELYHRPRQSLEAALRAREFGVIAEVKKASPSKGLIRADFDPVKIGRQYQGGGASAVSVLTDEKFFSGRLDYLRELRRSIDIPLLRKDFILDVYQLHEARSAGADAVLLIVASLDRQVLMKLFAEAAALGLESLVEVHTDDELETAVAMGARLIGVNNRDLSSLQTRIGTSFRLGPRVPAGCVGVSESGIVSGDDLLRLKKAGFRGALIGEFLMGQEDPGEALRRLLEDYAGRAS